MFESNGGNGFGDGGFGGGFSSGGGFANGSQGGGGDRQKKMRNLNIVPVTTKIIKTMTMEDSLFKLDGEDVNQVTLVGSIAHHEKSQMCNTYQLDDTHGVVTLKHWISDNEEGGATDEAADQEFEVGTYVRVFAQLRSFQKSLTLNVLHMRSVEDHNEITTHILECMKYKKMMMKKSSNNVSSNEMTGLGFNGMSNSSVMNSNGLDGVQSQIWKLVNACDDPQGLNVKDIQSSLKGLSSAQIRKALDFLSNEGHIYSTINDDHYRSTS